MSKQCGSMKYKDFMRRFAELGFDVTGETVVGRGKRRDYQRRRREISGVVVKQACSFFGVELRAFLGSG